MKFSFEYFGSKQRVGLLQNHLGDVREQVIRKLRTSKWKELGFWWPLQLGSLSTGASNVGHRVQRQGSHVLDRRRCDDKESDRNEENVSRVQSCTSFSKQMEYVFVHVWDVCVYRMLKWLCKWVQLPKALAFRPHMCPPSASLPEAISVFTLFTIMRTMSLLSARRSEVAKYLCFNCFNCSHNSHNHRPRLCMLCAQSEDQKAMSLLATASILQDLLDRRSIYRKSPTLLLHHSKLQQFAVTRSVK